MNAFISRLFGFALGVACVATPALADDTYPDARRIVSVGGTVTEILYALGVQDRIVARDSTSLYPADAATKPDVGYMRQLSAEGIISQNPDLILAESGAGPADTIAILQAGSVPLVSIPTPPTAKSVGPRIRAVGAAVGKPKEAEALATDVEARLATLTDEIGKLTGAKKRVLFALSLANGRVMAAGRNTAADAMIRLAGAANAVESVEGYKPLTDEAVIEAAPDAILIMNNPGRHMTADEAFAIPALKASPAGQSGTLIAMDGLYLLGLGPRTPQAARELASKLYPDHLAP
ncbi:ABC transporter substrate-binding protein [Ciceribacter sp. L1K22]|uniref:heme/hemin ABC transporter substrate-binding protein n=1 Tax=Ciceribacter sp. L1K22 TaxID=2820275 RepID=UPI001ABE484E|nr:ABC transporter substrate-binding protein [Ciceribacter sp. L1K22]MBO3760734.1 ABC transporter substrate-binding protein [Ciceribacter sp. L1K22]